jgi:hypothetical protein
LAASTLFTASDPFGDAITEYDFWNSGSGNGHFLLNGQVLGASQDNYVSASQLTQTTYQSGSGADTLWVRVSEVRTSRGISRALLFSQAILLVEWEANAPLREAMAIKGERWRVKRAEERRVAAGRAAKQRST